MRLKKVCLALFTVFVGLSAAEAFPPAPAVLIYGMVRDEYGNEIGNASDRVILQTASGAQVTASIQPNLAIGVNYALSVPMDSWIVPTLYATNALTNGQSYTLYVYHNGSNNVPLEMLSGFFHIAAPSQSVVQNLTLGSDANRDGIPDAWEAAFLSSLGINVSLSQINPNGVYTPDGRTLYQEFLLGNYPYHANAFSVALLSLNGGSALIAFTALANHTYTVLGSSDLATWTPLSFTIPANGPGVIGSYFSSLAQPLEFQTIQPTNSPVVQFFKLNLR